MHKYVIMGVQGSGKGTQAKKLADEFGFVHISAGDIFREHIKQKTELGQKIAGIVDSGHLVPDEIVEKVMRKRLDEHDPNAGFILDGFPRSRHQAGSLLSLCEIDAVILIEVADEVVLERMLARRLCSNCRRDFNLIHNPPKVEGACDECGETLVTRADDNERAIRERLAEYHSETEPVLGFLGEKVRIVTVDGAQPPEDVQSDIRQQLGLETG